MAPFTGTLARGTERFAPAVHGYVSRRAMSRGRGEGKRDTVVPHMRQAGRCIQKHTLPPGVCQQHPTTISAGSPRSENVYG